METTGCGLSPTVRLMQQRSMKREQAGQGVLVLISGGTVGAAKGRGKAAEAPLSNLESI